MKVSVCVCVCMCIYLVVLYIVWSRLMPCLHISNITLDLCILVAVTTSSFKSSMCVCVCVCVLLRLFLFMHIIYYIHKTYVWMCVFRWVYACTKVCVKSIMTLASLFSLCTSPCWLDQLRRWPETRTTLTLSPQTRNTAPVSLWLFLKHICTSSQLFQKALLKFTPIFQGLFL